MRVLRYQKLAVQGFFESELTYLKKQFCCLGEAIRYWAEEHQRPGVARFECCGSFTIWMQVIPLIIDEWNRDCNSTDTNRAAAARELGSVVFCNGPECEGLLILEEAFFLNCLLDP